MSAHHAPMCTSGCRGFAWVLLLLVALVGFLPAALSSMKCVGSVVFGSSVRATCLLPERKVVKDSTRAEQPAQAETAPDDLKYGYDGRSIVVPWLADSLRFAGYGEHATRRALADWRLALAYLDASQYGRAATAFARLGESLPESTMRAGCFYNAACAEARRGETASALQYLARAMQEGFRDDRMIGLDDDLASLRDEPAYRHLMNLSRTRDWAALESFDLETFVSQASASLGDE